MLLLLLAYFGGVLTIFSPCVLPVVPFIFSRSDQPFRKAGLPMLIGMGLSFALFGALSVTGGTFVVQANQYGRVFALVLFTVLGLTLCFPRLADRLSQPFIRLGGALQKKAEKGSGVGSSLLMGASVGLLWAPCAGPILGLLLAGAATQGASQRTAGLLFVFAAGAATSLGVAIFAGGKVLRVLKKGLGAEEWIKRGLGVVVLCGVLVIATGFDTKVLSKISFLSTTKIEQALVDQVSSDSTINQDQVAPPIRGAIEWIHSKPLSLEELRGKVVLIDFWTYSCINCLRTLPYLKAWHEKYKDQGLVIIGVHTPEFAFEKDISNVQKAVNDLGISYPVAIDNDRTIWKAYRNKYWPAHYFIDRTSLVRYKHFGEGGYEESERMIQALLGAQMSPVVKAKASVAAEEQASRTQGKSPETYLGYLWQKGFVSNPNLRRDMPQGYLPTRSPLLLNQWSLVGEWRVEQESSSLISTPGSLSIHFKARDLHLVMGADILHREIRFRVTLDGRAPGEDHGSDIDREGNGVLKEHRLYQLIRQKKGQKPRVFQIEFLDEAASVFAFTFG
jgi:cytochrome c biogenesis protein CcdA/thiol-disulfide isomerase/thioredoxin